MKGMAEKHCSNEDLLLYYYGELDGQRHRELAEHLATCAACSKEWQRLQDSLERVPRPTIELEPAETRKFAARVAARAQRRDHRKLWLWGGALTATAVLALSLIARPPGIVPGQEGKLVADAAMVQELDLLQNLDLLEELDLLQDLAGQG